MARTERQRLVNFNTSTTANMPDTDDFDHGEIAVRYNTDNPELIIKRADNSLVTFKPNSVKIYQNLSGSAFPGQSATCDVTDGNIISYFDGLTVMMKLGYAPDPEYGLSFQINELGYKPVEYSDGTHVGDEWVSGDEIMLVYNWSMEDSTGAWQVVNSKKSSSVVVRTWESTQEGPDYLCFTALQPDLTLNLEGEYSETYDGDDFGLEYSSDGQNWSNLGFTKGELIDGSIPCVSDTLVFNHSGDKVYFRGNNPLGTCSFDPIIDPYGHGGYGFTFKGTSIPGSGSFEVTGDIQTIVDKDGEDKEHGCFAGLFANNDGSGILITSAPDLTATALVPSKYLSMFANQTYLTIPANMASFTFNDIPLNEKDGRIYPAFCFASMYYYSGLEYPADFNGLHLSGMLTETENYRLESFLEIYDNTENLFITNDNGETLIGFSGFSFPFVSESGETLTSFNIAESLLGNTNGFEFANLYSEPNVQEYGNVHFNHIDSTSGSVWVPTSGSVDVEVVASPNEGYQFVKWQYSSDGQEYTDISGATDTTYNTVLVQPGDYYYKGVFAENPDYLCFTANKAGSTLRMTGIETLGFSGGSFSLEYSTDGDTWQDLNFTSSGSPEEGLVTRVSDTLTFDSVGDKVYFRGDNPSGTSTAGVLFGSLDMGYHYIFAGGENTETVDNEFSVGGDIQTIVDKTGLNKTAGCFYSLFGAGDDRDLYPEMILITSAPDLTATVLTDYCYYVMFVHQTLLGRPAEFPALMFDCLSGTSLESYMLGEMYLSCYGLLEPANLNSLVFSGYSDLQRCYYNLNGIYENNTFDITEDNGASIAGFGGLVFPYELNVSGDTLSMSSANFAGLVGNYNGFDTVKVVFNTDSQSYGNISFNVDESLVIHGGGSNYWTPNILWLQNGGNVPITVTASPEQGYHFVKWQSSSDGDTWTDIPGATNPVYAETITAVGHYYYKPVFESDN